MVRRLAVVAVLIGVTVIGARSEELGETIDVGQTGFDVHRPVLASACPHGCTWGELGEFVRSAMETVGYDVILCRNCNRAYGPPLVSKHALPPPLDALNLRVGTTQRVNAPVDFGVTSTDNLAHAYRGTHRYADDGPFENLRLIARIDDPRWLMVAVKADSGITDLAQIRERGLAVHLLADMRRPAIQRVLEFYGLDEQQIRAQGGSVARPSILDTDAEFDVIIDNNASPANNPEAAYWTAYTWSHELRFLALPEALLNELATDDLALERATAKWGLLRGVDRPIDTVIRNGHAIFGRDDMPDQVAYDIARAVYQHREALGSYIRPYAYHPDKVADGFGVPLHPGARRFYRDAGLLQPACVPTLKRLPMPASTPIYRPPRSPAVPDGQIEEEYGFACSARGTTYRTTLNLIRPARGRDFSGVVIVEPTHPGNLWPVRTTTGGYLTHEGHASVVVNSSHMVVERLVKPSNPDRYGKLSVSSTPRMEPEILHQLALAIARGELGVQPKAILLAGYSNTAARVRAYIDYFRHRYDGAFDGFLVGQTAVGTLPGPLPDLEVPIIELEGERELIAARQRNPNGLTWRRADGPLFRLYEVPGMAHLDTRVPERLSFPPSACGIETVSSFPLGPVWSNTLHALIRWSVDGQPAPAASRIETEDDGSIRRDEHGNALGGVPVPPMVVPAATILTASEPSPGYPRARCDMIGPEFPFSADQLTSLYGSPRGYVRAFTRALDRAIDDGWYLPMYRQEALSQARKRAESRAR